MVHVPATRVTCHASQYYQEASIFMLPLNAFGGYYDQATLLLCFSKLAVVLAL